MVISSADSIMQNGGALAPSGSLMLAVAAKKYRVPVLVLGRAFNLTEKTMIGQDQLLDN